MKNEIAIIIIGSLLIATTFPIATAIDVDELEPPSSGLAFTTSSNKVAEIQFYNEIEGLNIQTLRFYGYCAWDPPTNTFEGPVFFNSTTPDDIKKIKQTSSEGFISGGTWALGKWYGCEYSLGEWKDPQPFIWTIHPVIGEMTVVGNYDPDGTNLTFNGLAYDHNSEIMYGCSSNALYEVNMDTGASSYVGNFGLSECIMIAIAFDDSGNLYGTELVTDSLYSIDPQNGEATKIGSLGININYQQDMAFDIDSGTLYLSAYTISPVKEGALYTCNTETGDATKVGTFQGSAEITGFAIPYSGIPKILSSSVKGGNLIIGESKLQCTIKNIGGLRCTNVTLSITSQRGIILGLGTKPIVYYLEPGKTANISSQTLFGIGFPMVTLIITATQESSKKTYSITKDALVFGILWRC